MFAIDRYISCSMIEIDIINIFRRKHINSQSRNSDQSDKQNDRNSKCSYLIMFFHIASFSFH